MNLTRKRDYPGGPKVSRRMFRGGSESPRCQQIKAKAEQCGPWLPGRNRKGTMKKVWIAPQSWERTVLWLFRSGMQPSSTSTSARQIHVDAHRTVRQQICVLGHETKVISLQGQKWTKVRGLMLAANTPETDPSLVLLSSIY